MEGVSLRGGTGPELVVCRDAGAVATAAANLFEDVIAAATARGSSARIALSGGSTPALLLRLLSSRPIDWPRVHLYWSDERMVPPDHPDSNYGLAARELLATMAMAAERVHRVRTEAGPGERVARLYEEEIRRDVAAGDGGLPRFDLVYLGMGEDGHTASLFPASPVLAERSLLVAAAAGPSGAARITMTLPLLGAAAVVAVLVTGAAKAATVAAALAPGGRLLPIAQVRPTAGRLVFIIDRAAASKIPPAIG